MDPATNSTRLKFTGSALGLAGRALVATLSILTIIPAPWGATWCVRWFIKNTWVGEERAEFIGKAKDAWWLFMLIVPTSLFIPLAVNLYNYYRFLSLPGETKFDFHWSDFILGYISYQPFLIPGIIVLYFVLRLLISQTKLTQGNPLVFRGNIFQFIGLKLLYELLACTFFLWAWGVTILLRWVFKNTHGENIVLKYGGSSWGLFLRGVIVPFAAMIFFGVTANLIILTTAQAFQQMPFSPAESTSYGFGIPELLLMTAAAGFFIWYAAWLIRWIVSQIAVHSAVETPTAALPDSEKEETPLSPAPEA